MLKTITTSDLRTRIGRVLNEVGYGGVQYLVSKSGQPTVAIISLEDFRLLQAARKQQAGDSLRATLANIRERNRDVDAEQLTTLIEEARTVYYKTQSGEPDAR